jgi:hypothetical protein
VLDGGTQRRRSLVCMQMVVLVDKDGDMDFESEVRIGAFESDLSAKREMADT